MTTKLTTEERAKLRELHSKVSLYFSRNKFFVESNPEVVELCTALPALLDEVDADKQQIMQLTDALNSVMEQRDKEMSENVVLEELLDAARKALREISSYKIASWSEARRVAQAALGGSQ